MTPAERNRIEIEALALAERQEAESARTLQQGPRYWQAALQGLGRGTAEVAGLPLDLGALLYNASAGALNLADYGAEKLFGTSILPGDGISYMGSPTEHLADVFFRTMTEAGIPLVDPNDMGLRERGVYEGVRFGSGAGLQGAALAARAARQGARTMPRMFDSFTKPYADAPVRTIARDTAAGAGSGAGLAVYETAIPEEDQGILGPFLSMLAGGAASGGVIDMATAPKHVFDAVRRVGVDPDVPYAPRTDKPVSRATSEDASRYLVDMAGGPVVAKDAAQNALENAQFAEAAGMPAPPLGQASQNVGLAQAERAVTNQSKMGVPVLDRNRDITTAAAGKLRNMVPDAPLEDYIAVAETKREGALTSAQQDVAEGMDRLAVAKDRRVREGAELRAATDRPGSAVSERLDRHIVDETLLPMQERSSRMYNAIDPNRTAVVDSTPLIEAAETVRDSLGTLNTPDKVIPRSLLARIERTGAADEIMDDAGNIVQEAKDAEVSIGDMVEVFPEISSTIERARKAGNYTLADNLRALRTQMDDMITGAAEAGDPAAQRAIDAQANYKATVGETFGGGPGNEARQFRKDYNLDRHERSTTPPSQTAKRFLQPEQPEKAESLVRILERSHTPDEAKGAARAFVLGQAADSVIGSDGKISSQAVGKFVRKWGATLDKVPGLRREFDALIDQAKTGEIEESALTDAIRKAKDNLALTETEIADSALALVAGKTPSKAVAAIFGSGNPPVAMRDLKSRIRDVPGAEESLRAAVADHLYRKLTTTATGRPRTHRRRRRLRNCST